MTKERVETKNQPAKSKRTRLFFLVSLLFVVSVIFVVLRREQTNQEMLLAVQMGEPSKLDSTLKWGADPNRLVGKSNVAPRSLMDLIDALLHPEKNPYSSRPVLIAACTVGNTEVVRVLLKHGANKNYIMTDRRTPLHFAAARSKSPVIRVLLEYKADFNLKDKLGRTPLHVAAENASPDCCEALLEYGAKTDALDKANYTPLMTALNFGQPKNALMLLKHGASIDDFNFNMLQAPPVSTPKDPSSVNQTLFFPNNNPAIRVSPPARPITPPGQQMHWAAGRRYLPLIKYLYEERLSPEDKKSVRATDLGAAAASGNEEITNYFLSIGVDINSSEGGGSRLLCSAISVHDYKMAHFLIDKGVHVNREEPNGNTPLGVAVKSLYTMQRTVYVEKGTLSKTVQRVSDDGFYITVMEEIVPMQKLMTQQREPIVQLIRELISKGADVKAVDLSGNNPLSYVLAEPDLVKLFIDKGADVKSPLKWNDTYLMHSLNMSSETAERLIQAGEGVNARGAKNTTALMQAVKYFNSAVVKVLLKHGADPKPVDANGKTALYYATQNGYVPVLKLLKGAGVSR